MACLDTTALIDLNGSGSVMNAAAAKVATALARGESLCVTRVSIAELYVGVQRSRTPLAEAAKVQRVLHPCIVLEFDDAAAREFGRIKATLLSIGRPSGDFDTAIAAMCLSYGQSLITRNERHFRQMPGMIVEAY